MVNIPDLSQGAGIPSQWTEDLTATDIALITGHEPGVMTRDQIVAASQTIPALAPVTLDANKRLILATDPAVPCIGIAVIGITTDASTTYKGLPVYRAGCFNPDKLAWHAAFDTEAEKFGAFDGAATPTNIVIRRPKTASV